MANLQSWQSGISGNPAGRPKGSKNVKTVIRELLNSQATNKLLPIEAAGGSTPLEAIICTLAAKAIDGDVRAADVLLKYSVDPYMPSDTNGFFSTNQITITIVDPKAQNSHKELSLIESIIDSSPIED